MKDFVYRSKEKKGELFHDGSYTRKPAGDFTKSELEGVDDILTDGEIPQDMKAKLPEGAPITKLKGGEDHHTLLTGKAAQKALAARCERCKAEPEERPVSG